MARISSPTASAVATAAGAAAIALGSCLPWMYWFAGLVPLRGLIGLNGRLFLAAGVAAFALAFLRSRADVATRGRWRVFTALLGATVSAGAVWLLIGVWELTRTQGSNAMLAPRPGIGLWVVLSGGVLVALAAAMPVAFSFPSWGGEQGIRRRLGQPAPGAACAA